jgi:hypothetical protein
MAAGSGAASGHSTLSDASLPMVGAGTIAGAAFSCFHVV